MQDYELDAWLGDVQVTDEQRAALHAASDAIGHRYADDRDSLEQAFSGAAQLILGDDTLEALTGVWTRAKIAEREAMAVLTGAIIASSDLGDTEISRVTGVNRMTVRKALGK